MMVSGISATEVMVAVCFTVDSETQCNSEQYNVMTQQTSKCLQDNNSRNRSSSQKSTTDRSSHSAYCFALRVLREACSSLATLGMVMAGTLGFCFNPGAPRLPDPTLFAS